MHRFLRIGIVSVLFALTTHAHAVAAPPVAEYGLGARVELRLDSAIDTRRTRTGEALKFTLISGECEDGQRLRGGAAITGRVVHAQKAGMFGKAGELLIAADPWSPEGAAAPVRFRDLRAISGRNRDGTTIGVAVVAGPFAAFVRGGNVVIPPGTLMQAEIRDVTAVPYSALEPCAPAPADAQVTPTDPPVSETPPQGELHEAHDVRPVDTGREPAPEPGNGADAAEPRNADD